MPGTNCMKATFANKAVVYDGSLLGAPLQHAVYAAAARGLADLGITQQCATC